MRSSGETRPVARSAGPEGDVTFSIVVPTYNRPERLAACLDSLVSLEYPRDRYEVLIVDDGSTGPLDGIVQERSGDVAVRLHRQPNQGPAAARNAGIELATGSWIAFTDDDCAPSPSWLTELAGAARAHPDALLGGHTVNGLSSNPFAEASQLLVTYLHEELCERDADGAGPAFFASNNIALPADRLRRIGGFDTEFPLAAGEDRDLSGRWRHSGGRLVQVPDATVVHHHDLGLRSYWRQHFAYGRGAFRFHQARAERGDGTVRLEPLTFYRNLLALTILIGVVALYLVLRPVTRITRTTSRTHSRANAGYAVGVTHTVGLAREIRVFGAAPVVRDQMAAQAEEVARSGFTTRMLGKLTPRLYQFAALLLVVVGLWGVYLADVGEVASLGAVVLLLVRALTYSQDLQASIQQAGEVAPYLEALDRQNEVYLASPVASGTELLAPVDHLVVRDVDFDYEPATPVLRGVSFEVAAGETIGIVGPSGGGKSTLVQILLGLRAPQSGEYLVNGRPAAEHDLSSWFEQFTLVPQDNRLLSGTVADNIRFHRALDDEAVERAARAAHIHDDIVALALGYETPLGSGATDLSGGQRQRLGLARALAGRPSVLVLDEPTSALDMRSEALVQETLAELHGELTLFIVAHRLSTLSRCGRIMVLDGGRIDAFDTPEELQRSNAFFREMTRLSARS